MSQWHTVSSVSVLMYDERNDMMKEKAEERESMYDVLVAEDEPVERQVVRFLLEKYGLPFRVTEAANGQQALELLEKQRFHVLFTDIQMPFVDGLTLARQAREENPELQVVFFSGHGDFEYVKQALSLQAVSYILKPVNPEEFHRTFLGIQEQLQVLETSANRERSVKGAVRRSALLQLIGGVSPKRLVTLYPQWDFSFLEGYHRMLLLRMERQGEGDPVLPWTLVQALLPEDTQCVTLKPGCGIVLFEGKRHQSGWYRELTERILRKIRENGGLCRGELSHSFETPEDIQRIYQELTAALRDKAFFAGEERTESPDAGDGNVLLKGLESDIRLRDGTGLTAHMGAFLERCGGLSSTQVRYLCTKALTLLLENLPGDTGASFAAYSRVIQEESFSRIRSLLLELTRDLTEAFAAEQRPQSHAVVLAKQYIHQNYAQPLSLNLIADRVHLSARYLSALFMEEEGIGINRYIKKVRSQKASELLLGTNMKVNEICERVGYANLSYFCKCFQDDFGMTPDKFRSQTKQGKGAPHDTKKV